MVPGPIKAPAHPGYAPSSTRGRLMNHPSFWDTSSTMFQIGNAGTCWASNDPLFRACRRRFMPSRRHFSITHPRPIALRCCRSNRLFQPEPPPACKTLCVGRVRGKQARGSSLDLLSPGASRPCHGLESVLILPGAPMNPAPKEYPGAGSPLCGPR